ncbi:MAG: CPBP family intramembrane metalloprotease [Bacteroidales bacterium]|jgi:membrane protease YdiL (CAAX protease family)|nr:CPBP family intramembrane metalloprotease [Bacteroidales bacterium]
MEQKKNMFFPTVIEAAHTVILYLFIEAVIDLPLAIWDLQYGTNFLSNPAKRNIVNPAITVFILWLGYRKAQVPILELFPFRRFNPLFIMALLLIMPPLQLVIDDVNILINNILPVPYWFMEMFSRVFENSFGISGVILKVVIIAPITEELLFRGIIMHGFMRNYSGVQAVLVSALFFALFHLNPWQFPATFTLGLLLGWLMLQTRNILLCIVGHALNNGLALLLMEFQQPLMQSAFFRLPHPVRLLICTGLLMFGFGILIFRTQSLKNIRLTNK